MAVAFPKFLYDNKFRYGGTFTSATPLVEASASIQNLKDWRPYTFWKPSVAVAGFGIVDVDVAAPGLAWEFTNSADGWSVAQATLTNNATFITLTSTGTDPQFVSPDNLNYLGRTHRYIMVRIRRVSGSGWQGRIFYTTTARTATSGSFQGEMAEPVWDGNFKVIIADMHALAVGGTEYRDSIIKRLRFDFGTTSSDVFDIDWICVSRNPYADYFLVWGHDLSTKGCGVWVEGSYSRPADWSLDAQLTSATFVPQTDAPFVVTFSRQAYRTFRFVVQPNITANPAIAIAAIGESLASPVGLPYGFDPLGRKVHGQTNTSRRGYPLGKVIDWREWSADVELKFVSWSWVRQTFLPAWEAHLEHTPFVFAWDPGDHADELYLVQAGDELELPHNAGEYVDLSVPLMGVAE